MVRWLKTEKQEQMATSAKITRAEAVSLMLMIFLFRSCCTLKVWGIEFTNEDSEMTDICNMTLSSDITSETGHKSPAQCTCDVSMTETDCSDLEIARLPSLISFPRTVRVVNFRENRITDINDDTFYSGSQVNELNLSNNRINFLSIESFKAFGELRRLVLSHNALWNLHSNVFDWLTRLRHLDLSFNDIEGLQSDTFKKLGMLKDLKLNSNPLHVLEPNLFEHLSQLELLDLSATMFNEIPDLIFTFTPNLKILTMSSNLLSKVPTPALKVLKKLKVLDLSSNKFEVIESGSFEGLTSLSILYLDNMPNLKTLEAFAFGDLRLLTELHCSYNHNLYHVDKDAFLHKASGKRVELDQLSLRQNNLDTLSQDLQSWNKLMELHLRSNNWNCDCRLQWMLDTEVKNEFQDHVQCAMPMNLKGKSMSEVKSTELVCGSTLSETDVVVICVAAVVLLLLVLLIGIILRHWSVRKRESETIYRLQILKKEQSSESDLEYDDRVF